MKLSGAEESLPHMSNHVRKHLSSICHPIRKRPPFRDTKSGSPSRPHHRPGNNTRFFRKGPGEKVIFTPGFVSSTIFPFPEFFPPLFPAGNAKNHQLGGGILCRQKKGIPPPLNHPISRFPLPRRHARKQSRRREKDKEGGVERKGMISLSFSPSFRDPRWKRGKGCFPFPQSFSLRKKKKSDSGEESSILPRL